MKVLLVHNFYRSPGGEDRYVRTLEEALPARGVRIVTLYAASDPRPRLRGRLAAAWRLVAPAWGLARIRALHRRERFDVAHIHNLYPLLGARSTEALRRRGVPVVMTCHNFRLVAPCGVFARRGMVCELCGPGNYLHMIRHNCRESRVESVLYAAALGRDRARGRPQRAVDRFLAPSRFLATKLAEYGLPADRIQVLRLGIHVPRERVEPGGGHGALYVGRLSWEKGVQVLLAALTRSPEIPLTIVGEGPLRPLLERTAAGLPSGQVTFRGHLGREGVLAELRRAAFVVMPSVWYENFPLAGVEAMAMGRPLIVAGIGGLPELVDEGAAGLIVPSGDADALAVAMRQLAADESLARALGAAGQRRVFAELTIDAHLDRLIGIYEEVRRARLVAPDARVVGSAPA